MCVCAPGSSARAEKVGSAVGSFNDHRSLGGTIPKWSSSQKKIQTLPETLVRFFCLREVVEKYKNDIVKEKTRYVPDKVDASPKLSIFSTREKGSERAPWSILWGACEKLCPAEICH